MILQMTTPALIFPAISLIMLAYTNRFLGLSSVIRSLTHEYQQHPDDALLLQIDNLQRRVIMVRNMQLFGVLCIMFSIASIWALSVDNQFWGICLFIACLVCMAVSSVLGAQSLALSHTGSSEGARSSRARVSSMTRWKVVTVRSAPARPPMKLCAGTWRPRR